MYAIFRKEFNTFFAQPVGYGIIGLFLVINGLLLWYIKGPWNVFQIGFADLQAFFDLTPWLLLLLIPAITMRTFSDEFSRGTIEILKTRPLSAWEVVLGKYAAIFTVVLLSLLPTLLYSLSISSMALPEKLDWGALVGSYIGLMLLGATFSAIALWASLWTKNQILAFLLGVLSILLAYYTAEQFALWYRELPVFLQNMSLYHHFQSISRGVVDSRDLLFFGSVIFLFLWMTKYKYDRI